MDRSAVSGGRSRRPRRRCGGRCPRSTGRCRGRPPGPPRARPPRASRGRGPRRGPRSQDDRVQIRLPALEKATDGVRHGCFGVGHVRSLLVRVRGPPPTRTRSPESASGPPEGRVAARPARGAGARRGVTCASAATIRLGVPGMTTSRPSPSPRGPAAATSTALTHMICGSASAASPSPRPAASANSVATGPGHSAVMLTPLPRELLRRRPRVREDEGLAPAVAGLAGKRLEGRRRGDVEDGAAATLHHARQERASRGGRRPRRRCGSSPPRAAGSLSCTGPMVEKPALFTSTSTVRPRSAVVVASADAGVQRRSGRPRSPRLARRGPPTARRPARAGDPRDGRRA